MTRALLTAFLLLASFALCQSPSPGSAEKPLPGIVALMHEVEAHQKTTETLERDYLFHSFAIEKTLDGHGKLKKSQSEDSEIFYVAGVRIRRLLKRDGRDLAADEQGKESRRIDKEVEKAKGEQGKGRNHERDEITVSRFLALGSFTNARRTVLDGRDTIAIEFVGNPEAKTESRFEAAIRELTGTVWIDEEDRALHKLEGRFLRDFKVGGGLLADIKEGTTFSAAWTKVNGEVWLPATFSGRGDLRLLLLINLHGSLEGTNSGYRKFKATSTIVPVASP